MSCITGISGIVLYISKDLYKKLPDQLLTKTSVILNFFNFPIFESRENPYLKLVSLKPLRYRKLKITLEVIYQTRETVFHRDIQTPRKELKINGVSKVVKINAN